LEFWQWCHFQQARQVHTIKKSKRGQDIILSKGNTNRNTKIMLRQRPQITRVTEIEQMAIIMPPTTIHIATTDKTPTTETIVILTVTPPRELADTTAVIIMGVMVINTKTPLVIINNPTKIHTAIPQLIIEADTRSLQNKNSLVGSFYLGSFYIF